MKTTKISFINFFTSLVLFLSSTTLLNAQDVAINKDVTNPDSSSILDVKSDSLGILVPLLTKAQRDAISSPAIGLIVFQTDSISGFYYFNGSDWVVIGKEAMSINDLIDGKKVGNNVILGKAAGFNVESDNNVSLGDSSLNSSTTGWSNVAIGISSLNNNNKSYLVAIGDPSLYNNGTDTTHSTSLEVNTAVSSKALYQKITAPPIYGELDNYFVTIYNNLGLGKSEFGSGTKTLAIQTGKAPTSSVANGVLLYAQNVSGSAELKVRDEIGNVTTLSPHNFSMLNKSEPLAWSFYSENHRTGQKISVDMLKAIRLLEKISGEKLVYIQDIEDNTIQEENLEMKGIIEKQQEKIDQQEQLIKALITRIENLENK